MSDKIYFKVTFLSDILLNASSNTEGKIDVLDYITGSSFLGMVAKNYNDFKNPFDIFHSGKVKFGEATPLLNDKKTYKIPFSFFYEKGEDKEKEVYNHHFVTSEITKNKQLKQHRDGFITKDLDFFTLDYNYEQKTAFDKKLRRSKDSSMFGYQALRKGLVWVFEITFNDIDEDDKQKVIKYLVGEKNLGKSKQTQYGKIKIEKIPTIDDNIEQDISELTHMYVNSSLSLIDKNGFPTFIPTKESLGIVDGNVELSKSQIRTKEITPYNFVRKTNDSSRLVIQKGSVIVLKDLSNKDKEKLKSGIGMYLSEGYGDVLLNPSFLLKKDSFSLNKIRKYDFVAIKNDLVEEQDNTLIQFLKNREDSKKSIQTLGEDVKNFIDENKSKFKKVNKSQWGQIRAILQVNKKDYKKEIEEFINHGVSDKQWKDGFDTIKNILDKKSPEFLKLLAIQMPKQKDKQGDR